MKNKDPEKQKRLEQANELIRLIAHYGRKFFAHSDRVSYFDFDYRGRVWFVDAYREARIYTHYSAGRWNGFSEGGTLRDVVIRLRDYIMTGRNAGNSFGPWPEWYSQGDPWGYGADMQMIYRAAVRLGIVTAGSIENTRNPGKMRYAVCWRGVCFTAPVVQTWQR